MLQNTIMVANTRKFNISINILIASKDVAQLRNFETTADLFKVDIFVDIIDIMLILLKLFLKKGYINYLKKLEWCYRMVGYCSIAKYKDHPRNNSKLFLIILSFFICLLLNYFRYFLHVCFLQKSKTGWFLVSDKIVYMKTNHIFTIKKYIFRCPWKPKNQIQLDSQSRGFRFKTTTWLQGQLSLSSFQGQSNEYQELLRT